MELEDMNPTDVRWEIKESYLLKDIGQMSLCPSGLVCLKN